MLEEDKMFFIEGTAAANSDVQIYIYEPQTNGNEKVIAPSLGTCLWAGKANESGFFSAGIHSRLLWNLAGKTKTIEAFFMRTGEERWQIQSQPDTNQNFYIGTHVAAGEAQIGAQGVIPNTCQYLCSSEEADRNLIKLKEAHIIKPSDFPRVSGANFLGLGEEDIALSKIDHTFYAGKQTGVWSASELSEVALKSLLVEVVKQEMTKKYPGYEQMNEITEKSIGDAYNELRYAPEVQRIAQALGDIFLGENAAKQDTAAQYIAELFTKVSGCVAPKCIAPTPGMVKEVFAPVSNPMVPNGACTNTESVEAACSPGTTMDLWVVCDSPTQQSTTISVPQAGDYKVIGYVDRGNWGQCQTGESFTVTINGRTSAISQDDADPGAITRRNELLGIFTMNAGTNTITMTSASAVCDQPNSVHIKKICLEPATSAPTCTLYINPSTINPGESATLTWTTTDATSANIVTDNIGSVNPAATSGITINPTKDTTYTMEVNGTGGQATCTKSIAVNDIARFQVEKYVSLDGTNYSKKVEAKDGDTVYYKVVITNNGNADGNTDVFDNIDDPTNGGEINRVIEGYRVNTFNNNDVIIGGHLLKDGMQVRTLGSGKKIEIVYPATVSAEGIPAGEKSSVTNVASLSRDGSSSAEVVIVSSLTPTTWAKDLIDIFLLWTGEVIPNRCLLSEETPRELEKNFYDNFASGSHTKTRVCGWDVIYTNGFSSPAIIIHSKNEVLLQPNFDGIQIAKASKKFSKGKNGWLLPKGKKSPIFYRYQSEKTLHISTDSKSCVQKKELPRYADFLQKELSLTDEEKKLLVQEIDAQLNGNRDDFYALSIGNPQQVSNIFHWNVTGKNLSSKIIAPLFFSIEKQTCNKTQFTAPSGRVKQYFKQKRIGFEVGEIE